MKGNEDCKRMLNDSCDEKLADENFTKKSVKCASGSSLPGVLLFNKNISLVYK